MLVLISYKLPEGGKFDQMSTLVEDGIRQRWRFSSYNTVIIPAKTTAEALDEFKGAAYDLIDLAARDVGLDKTIVADFIHAMGQFDIAVYAGEQSLAMNEFDMRLRRGS